MRQSPENIREAEVEDALIANLEIFQEILGLDKEVHLISRQLRLVNGKRRLDILLSHGNQILLVELKTGSFQHEHLEQVLSYKDELEKLQRDKQLIGGIIVPILLVTRFEERDSKTCENSRVHLHKYSPIDILTRYYEKVSDIARFMRIRPVDLGVFNIALINRVMLGLEEGFVTLKELSEFSKLSTKSIANHLRFAGELGLAIRRRNRYYLTDLGLKYISLEEESPAADVLSDEQAMLLRDYVAKDPFSSQIVFGIYTLVEAAFFLGRSSYPVDFGDLQQIFLQMSGKKYEWQTPRALSTATYMYLNYCTKVGLLGKVGRKIVITPAGFRFILMLQLHKSIEMIESLTREPW